MKPNHFCNVVTAGCDVRYNNAFLFSLISARSALALLRAPPPPAAYYAAINTGSSRPGYG